MILPINHKKLYKKDFILIMKLIFYKNIIIIKIFLLFMIHNYDSPIIIKITKN